MKFIQFLISLTITIALIVALNNPISIAPPLGKFLSPFSGFWQNAESGNINFPKNLKLEGLKDEVSVWVDDKRVPHIFAKNDEDLYFAQGYVMARDRLWQMEFISYAASGRASEIAGDKALNFDRKQRRLGLAFGAENSMDTLHSQPLSEMILNSFSGGVNAYINGLDERNLPVEYKLLNYRPEEWTPLKCTLLLKFMAKMLTVKEYDFEFTNALKLLGRETFDLLYPDFPPGIDPIIPVIEKFNFSPDTLTAPNALIPETFLSQGNSEKEKEMNGSNNWAVSGKKSVTGKPILCNDPHLGLQIPAIWYQMQLHSPDVNVYGVTIPGAPGIVIGFNETIAWGVTNGAMDVKDWYKIQFKDETKNEYLFDGQWLPSAKRIEEIKIKGQPCYFDTVIYTHIGPVTYDETFNEYKSPFPMALKWTAHNPSNEMMTFYLLNRAKNYSDYEAALRYYECPGQNFVFASASGDIAIRQQGKFVNKWKEQGKFLMDGTTSTYDWKAFIPFEHNPHVLNPGRGFVSSANQHPTDTTYPYYYNGIYEYYRNRRINGQLSAKEKLSVDDMKRLQNDNYNLYASEILPYLLTEIEQGDLNDNEKRAFKELAEWNYFNEKDLIAPIYFEVFWNNLNDLLWDEFSDTNIALVAPDFYITSSFLINHPEHPLADRKATQEIENVKILVNQAFRQSVKYVEEWKAATQKKITWAEFKGTGLVHWIPLLKPFNVPEILIGGNLHIINATNKTHGASWRMIVALGEKPEAWGIYPGGQSGNPGSPYYADFVSSWAAGEYFPLLFLNDEKSEDDRIIFKQTMKHE